MRLITIIAGSLILSSCGNPAAPRFVYGNYYMVGDKSCRRAEPVSKTLIMCSDKGGNKTGHRSAMSAKDLQMYQMQAMRTEYEYQQLNQSMQNAGRSFQNSAQQVLQQSQQYSVPQQPAGTPYGGSNGISFRQVGDTMIGSNGVTYRQVGSSVLGSDGTRCQMAGSTILCR